LLGKITLAENTALRSATTDQEREDREQLLASHAGEFTQLREAHQSALAAKKVEFTALPFAAREDGIPRDYSMKMHSKRAARGTRKRA